MNSGSGVRLGSILARVFLFTIGAAAIGWASLTLPKFWAASPIVDVATHIIAGEAYKPDVLNALAATLAERDTASLPARALGKAAIIHLRQAELAFATDRRDAIDARLDTLARATDEALANAPSDPFLWLVRYWLDNTRDGFNARHLRELQMSYALGANEGWIAVKRNRLALAAFPALPPALADEAVSEFAGLVRSHLNSEAADIAEGPGRPIRRVLFARLERLKESDRQPFAKLLYDRDFDDVPVPGVARPSRRQRY